MDTLTFISKVIEYLAWPVSAIAICVILKAPIENLFSRLNKAKHKDTEFDFNSGIQMVSSSIESNLNIADAVPQDSLGLINEAEGKIYETLEQLNIQTDAEKVKVLAKHHANLQIRSGYSEINHQIFGSQIAILQALNIQAEPVKPEFFKSFFDGAKKKYPEFYESYSFESYVNFLKATGMLNIKNGKYFLTVLGRGFLAFLAESGINVKRPY